MLTDTVERAREERLLRELQRRIAACREREKSLVPLRIDRRTVIMVPPGKCNEAYAQAYREKLDKTERQLRDMLK